MLVHIHKTEEDNKVTDVSYIGESVTDDEYQAYQMADSYVRHFAYTEMCDYIVMVQYNKEDSNMYVKRFEFKTDRLGIKDAKTISGEMCLNESNEVVSFTRFKDGNKTPWAIPTEGSCLQNTYGPGIIYYEKSDPHSSGNPQYDHYFLNQCTAMPSNDRSIYDARVK